MTAAPAAAAAAGAAATAAGSEGHLQVAWVPLPALETSANASNLSTPAPNQEESHSLRESSTFVLNINVCRGRGV